MKRYLKELGSKKPVPGGGSAAALVGALGAGLVEKVCNFTIGKKKFKPIEKDIRRILKNAKSAKAELIRLIELDKKAFLPVARAYKLPKDTDRQKAIRRQRIEQATRNAAKVPRRIAQICEQILPYCDRLQKDGNRLFVSDTRCARDLLRAASKGARNFI
jgi:formiminotetrahydrofolate cyclodeaminase